MPRAAITASLILATIFTIRAQQPQLPTFRAAVDLVHFGVTVVDKQGKPVTGLKPGDFQILENGRAQALKYFVAGEADEAPPLHLGLLFDTSGSMAGDIKDARTAAVKFVNTLDHAVDVTLVDFDTEVRVARFGPRDYERLVERIRGRKPDGWTALYDAIGVYLNGAQNQEGQKVLVLYTDGGDTTSSLTFRDMLDLCKASDVTVYAVGYMEHQGSGRMQQRSELERVAAITGGQAYFPGVAKDLDGVFEKIQQELAARYSLGYLSTDLRTDGAWRGVEIKLLRPDLKGVRLRTRLGYFAPYRVHPGEYRPSKTLGDLGALPPDPLRLAPLAGPQRPAPLRSASSSGGISSLEDSRGSRGASPGPPSPRATRGASSLQPPPVVRSSVPWRPSTTALTSSPISSFAAISRGRSTSSSTG
ncbi:MAG: VWA domain-containing protein [Chloroflexota bacterium]|nr:VWA domain-containing protein [Chloroflexota bacterium]